MMNGRRLVSCWALGMIFFCFAGLGCGERELAAPECVDDGGCGEGLVCDLGVCISYRSVEPLPTPEDPVEGRDDEEPSGDEESGDGDGVTPIGDGDGDGDSEEEPDPDPVAGSCSGEFESCDPELGNHGIYECLPQDSGGGLCFRSCERSGHAEGCAQGQYCWSTGDLGPAACFPSECAGHADCNGGTCIRFDNGHGACVEAGPLGYGQSCVTGGTACQSGLACDAPSGQAGTCMPVCDPFAVSPCASDFDEACSVRWRRSGVCTTYPHLADTLQVFSACSGAGDWCTHGVQCRSMGSSNFCMKFCRPGKGDCAGVSYQGEATICDNYWFAGDQALGFCFPPCWSDGDCGGDYRCVNQICRLPCPSGNAVNDCCGGSPDCEYRCEGGYCA